MSDSDAPGDIPRGGPAWRQGMGSQPPPPAVPAPVPDAAPPVPPVPPGSQPPPPPGAQPVTAAMIHPPARFHGATDPSGREDDLYHQKFASDARSPIPHMVVAFALIGASVWAMDWSALSRGATDPVFTSEWWTTVTTVLLPGEDIRLSSYSEQRMWITIGVLVVTALAIAWWIRRIGMNLRPGNQPFGSVLPIVTFPAWWLLPLTVGLISGDSPSRTDLLIRCLVALGILIAQFLLLRWPTLNRIWRAGNLPYDLVSIVLWLPMMVPWLMFIGSTTFTLIVTNENENPADSAWQPTQTMVDLARGATRVTSVAIVVLLVVVTAIQHTLVGRDRAGLEASRERTRNQRVRLPGTGA